MEPLSQEQIAALLEQARQHSRRAKVQRRKSLDEYKQKAAILSQLIQQDPTSFDLDTPEGKYPGITHKDTGSQFHVPRGVAGGIKAAADKNDRSYGCLMIKVDGSAGKKVMDYIATIPDSEVHPEGKEDKPHITVQYGFPTTKADKVFKIFSDTRPPKVKLGKLSIFDNDEFDVLKVSVISPDLRKMNKLVNDNFKITTDYPKYEPHLTLAYLNKGEGKKYVGKDVFKDIELTLTDLDYSTKDNKHTFHEMGQEKKAALAVMAKLIKKSQAITGADTADTIHSYEGHGKSERPGYTYMDDKVPALPGGVRLQGENRTTASNALVRAGVPANKVPSVFSSRTPITPDQSKAVIGDVVDKDILPKTRKTIGPAWDGMLPELKTMLTRNQYSTLLPKSTGTVARIRSGDFQGAGEEFKNLKDYDPAQADTPGTYSHSVKRTSDLLKENQAFDSGMRLSDIVTNKADTAEFISGAKGLGYDVGGHIDAVRGTIKPWMGDNLKFRDKIKLLPAATKELLGGRSDKRQAVHGALTNNPSANISLKQFAGFDPKSPAFKSFLTENLYPAVGKGLTGGKSKVPSPTVTQQGPTPFKKESEYKDVVHTMAKLVKEAQLSGMFGKKEESSILPTAVGAGAAALPAASLAQYGKNVRDVRKAVQAAPELSTKAKPTAASVRKLFRQGETGDIFLSGGYRGNPLGAGSEAAFGLPTGHGLVVGGGKPGAKGIFQGGSSLSFFDKGGVLDDFIDSVSIQNPKMSARQLRHNIVEDMQLEIADRKQITDPKQIKRIKVNTKSKEFAARIARGTATAKGVDAVKKHVSAGGEISRSSIRRILKANGVAPSSISMFIDAAKIPAIPIKNSPKYLSWLQAGPDDITNTFMGKAIQTGKAYNPMKEEGMGIPTLDKIIGKIRARTGFTSANATKGMTGAQRLTFAKFRPKGGLSPDQADEVVNYLASQAGKEYGGGKALRSGLASILSPKAWGARMGRPLTAATCNPKTQICTSLPRNILRLLGLGSGPERGGTMNFFKSPGVKLEGVFNKPRFLAGLKHSARQRGAAGIVATLGAYGIGAGVTKAVQNARD